MFTETRNERGSLTEFYGPTCAHRSELQAWCGNPATGKNRGAAYERHHDDHGDSRCGYRTSKREG